MGVASSETERLNALHDLEILDTPPESEFDGLVEAAAAVCGAPIASLTLVDADRLWFKAQVGLGSDREVPRAGAFCTLAAAGSDLLEVPDASVDPRFAALPMVSGDNGVRFYAGMPVQVGEGHIIGTICVFDRVPRRLDSRQRDLLRGLAAAAGKTLETRRALRAQEKLATSLRVALTELASSRQHLRHLYEATPAMLHSIDEAGRIQMVSDHWLGKLGYAREDVVGRHVTEFFASESRDQALSTGLKALPQDPRCEDVPYKMVTKDGRVLDVLLSAFVSRDEHGAPASFATVTDVTAQKSAEARLGQSEARYRGLVEDQSEMISLATPEGDLRFVNDAYARQFGMTPEEVVGRSLFDLIPEAAHQGVRDDLARACRSQVSTDNKNQIVLPDGRLRWFAWTNRAIRDAEGGMMIHSVGRDIDERVAGERRLRNSEARFRLLSESAPLGVFAATRRGICTYRNAQWHQIFGDRCGAPRREPWFAAVHPEDRDAIAERWQAAAQSGDEVFLAFRVGMPGGATRDVEVRARPKRGDAGRLHGFIGTAEDVTDRKASLRALARSEGNLRRLYESTPAMLHSIDRGGRLLMVSDLWLEKLGYERAEVIGRRSTEFMTAESRERAKREVPAFFARGWSKDVGYQMIARDGTLIDVLMSARLECDPEGEVLRSLTVIEDVTARFRTERALRDSEIRYREMADTTNDVITRLDLDLVRRYVSPACRSVLGYEPEELLGDTPKSVLHPEDADRTYTAMRRLADGHVAGDRLLVTYRFRHKGGDWIWIEGGLNLVRAPDGAPRHLICALRDVTERRRNAEELEAARAAAERAARSKAEFLANMSHELRTPLTGLLGIHDLLMGEVGLAPQHRQKLALAHEAGRSLLAVINDVLDFSKIEAGELTIESVPFDLGLLVTACRDFARQDAARKGLHLEATVPPGMTLNGDPTRLRQVLLNLVTNAVKFTANGRVMIAARYDEPTERLSLTVSDTGIGIPANKLATVFERFHQADGSTTRQFGGTGLGLSICKNLVELMGGTITVTSLVGVGSTFAIEIPAFPAIPVATEAFEGALRVMTSRRLLLAEDNRLNRAIIVEMLTRAGHRIVAVENGAEAVERLAADGPFDLVLMDIQMPILDGYSATRRIRQREAGSHRMPIVGLTANATLEDEASCAAAGMDAHVAKPIDWTVLIETVERLCAGLCASPRGGEAVVGDDVLDASSLATLAGIIGPMRLADMLQSFTAELRSQLGNLPHMPESEIAGCAHAWTSMAGHFGFVELQRAAADLQAEARAGRGVTGAPRLKAAAERAIAAAESCSYAVAA